MLRKLQSYWKRFGNKRAKPLAKSNLVEAPKLPTEQEINIALAVGQQREVRSRLGLSQSTAFNATRIHALRFFGLMRTAVNSAASLHFLKDPFYNWLVSHNLRKAAPDWFLDLIKLPPIGSCSHRKGMGPYKNPETEFGVDQMFGRMHYKDYDVYLHTFPDGRQRIHCRRCNQNWFKGDPGWDEAVAMTEQSTNRASSSEILLSGDVLEAYRNRLKTETIVTYQDKLGD